MIRMMISHYPPEAVAELRRQMNRIEINCADAGREEGHCEGCSFKCLCSDLERARFFVQAVDEQNEYERRTFEAMYGRGYQE